MQQAKFTNSPLGESFEKQVKAIENQGKKQIKATEDHRKQLAKSNALIKNMIMTSLRCLKQKQIFDRRITERCGEIQNLSR